MVLLTESWGLRRGEQFALTSATVGIEVVDNLISRPNRRFKFHKRSQLFIRTHMELRAASQRLIPAGEQSLLVRRAFLARVIGLGLLPRHVTVVVGISLLKLLLEQAAFATVGERLVQR
jgi:hypothetical protein